MATFADVSDASATIAWVVSRLQTKLNAPIGTQRGEPWLDAEKVSVADKLPVFDAQDAQALIDAQP